jgi:hypothetical protein
MRHHFRRPQAMFNKGSLFTSHCGRILDEFLYLLDTTVSYVCI